MRNQKSKIHQMGDILGQGVDITGDIAGVGLKLTGKAIRKSIDATRSGIHELVKPHNHE